MYALSPPSVRLAVILSLYLLVCSASPSYYIVTPSTTSDSTKSFAVHWFGDSDLTVTAVIRNNTNVLQNVTKVIKQDSIEIVTLMVQNPNVVVEINGSSQNTTVFSNTLFSQMETINTVFIQTNNAMYKPGEVVKIRVITVYSNLKPRTKNVDLIIKDPNNNIVQQQLNLTSDLGVISTQFQLASQPVLGDWIIQANVDAQNTYTTLFTVAENVVQRFDVNVDAPSFVFFSNKENFTGTVTAKYLFGKPVKGNLTISIMPRFSEIATKISKTYEISGSVNFSLTNEEISELSPWGSFNITATVHEELTGVSVQSVFYVRTAYSEYSLIVISQKPAFEPGQNITVQILVQRIDNKSLTNEERGKNVSVKVFQGTGSFANRLTRSLAIVPDTEFFQNYTISASGIVNVEIPVVQSLEFIRLEMIYQTASENLFFSKPNAYTPFINMNISETSLQVGKPFNLQISTNPEAQDIYYVVFAKGMVVAAGKNKTTFSLTPEHSWTPYARILVYFRSLNSSFISNGTIVPTEQILPVKGILRNQVTLSWSKSSAKPLENVALTVTVKESRSLVGLRVVEKKNNLLDDRNDLTASKVDMSFWLSLGFTQTLTDANVYTTEKFVERPDWNLVPSLLEQWKPEFIETWIWLETNISSSLSRSIQVTVPDKNTTWVATAFVMSEGLGLGITEVPVELSVMKPLVLILNMPNTVIRGEVFILEAMLFNSLLEDMQVVVTLVSNNSFDIIVPNNNSFVAGQRNVTVLRENGTVVFFPIRPKVLGNITITVTANSTGVLETVTRYIIVKAEGVKNYYSEATLFDVRSSGNVPGTVSKNFFYNFPSDLVEGSAEAFITVSGDVLGPSINGLDSLIRMPYGCGEQNMIVLAPNIYILLYLIATNQLTGGIRQQSITFMEQGYQRELTYRRSDNSFSAFGNYDQSGSTWLTSFVFRCFLQARPFIFISPDVLNEAAAFLVLHQDMNTGIFSEPGRVIHTELQGGLNGPITLTAYILISLLEDGYYRNLYATNIQKGVQYLESKYDEGIASNYTLSVVTYALTLAGSSKAQAALDQLDSRATKIVNAGTKYWSAPSESNNVYWQPRTTDIETAAYALLSFQRQNRTADGIPVMKWLTLQRNQFGGYVSTQDTVMALQALSQFVAAIPSTETSLVVTVTGPGSFVPKTFQVNSNLLALQIKQLEISQPLSVNATAVGKGLALVQFNVAFNTKALSRSRRSTVSEALILDLKVNENAGNMYKLTLEVSMSYQGDRNETGMVIVEVYYISGFQLSPEGIPLSDTVAKVEPEDNKVNLYLNSLTKNTVTVSVPLVRKAYVAGSQDAVVTVTEYYKTRNTVTKTYNSETMKSITYCDFCGLNCTQCTSNVAVKSETNGAYTYTPTFFMLCISVVFLSYLL